MICECPAAAAIPTIPVANCVESFGQIQKVAFQRLVKENGTKNAFMFGGKPLHCLLYRIGSNVN